MELSEQIYEIVKTSNGIKAKDIAQKLKIDKTDVNSCLYGVLNGKCYQESSYLWYAKDNKEAKNTEPLNKKPDEDLRNICRYYLNCISIDDSNGVKTYTSGQFGTDYAELTQINLENVESEGIKSLVAKMKGNRNMTAYFGYPVMIEKKISKKNREEYFFVSPVLLYQVELLETSGAIKVDLVPRINTEVLKKYFSGEQNALIYELIRLENSLGLDSQDANIELDELCERLVNIQCNWDWKEKINPAFLSNSVPISEIKEEGIYNRAVIQITEKSPFTKGLEKELNFLSTLSVDDYKNSALYSWIHKTEISNDHTNENQIIEVLPLNTEQEQAIKLALNNKLTVITGPPGTGKSQVVTDLLINIAWQEKSALFASKNNKAVDVVEKRVNGLGKRPIMLRVGSNAYANKIAELVQNLLSVISTPSDKIEYEKILSSYNLNSLFKLA